MTSVNKVMMRFVKSVGRISTGVVGVLFVVGSTLFVCVRQPTCGAFELCDGPKAAPERLVQHVRFLSEEVVPRTVRHPANLERAAAYVAEALDLPGVVVFSQVFRADGVQCRNIVARIGESTGPRIVVGAHYDACGRTPGADDNASGVAGLLELARLLSMNPPESLVELVAYSTEEPPHFGGPDMGSAIHAHTLRSEGADIRVMMCLEMIGYFTDEQPNHSTVLKMLYPSRGDFVAVVGRWQDRALARRVKRGLRGGGLPVVSYSGPVAIGADLSDHRNYWAEGYNAVMVTDTAYLRNPNYHTANDTADTLDYRRMAQVVDGVHAAIRFLQSEG